MSILSNSAQFSACRPLLPGYNFLATKASTYSTYRLGAVAFLKIFEIENMPPHFSAMYIIAKESWYHLIRGYASAQATLC